MSEGENVPGAAGASRRPRIVFLMLGVVLAAGLGIGLFSSIGVPRQGVPGVGDAAPPFSLARLGGGGKVGTPADGGGGGRPAVLLFFASWCKPCATEVPAIARAYRAQGGSKVALIGVDGSDPTSDALAFVHSSGVTFPVAVDSTYQVTEGLYYFTGDPDAVFINRQGTIVHVVHGPITVAQLRRWERAIG